MGDLDELYAPEPAAKPKAKARAPKAAPAGTGLPEDQFKAILEDPSELPSISKSGMSPAQQEAFRTAWPMTNQASKPEAQERAAALNGNLDRLHEYGERVFAAPKVDKRAAEAVQGYYRWLREEQKSETGEGAGMRKVIDAVLPTKHDPIASLKGPARQQAADMRDLVDHLKHAGLKEDELHILTSILPDPTDKPERIAQKRAAFATQLEELAQGLPPQFWRAAAKHTVRARRLRGPAEAPAAAAAAAKSAPASAAVPQAAAEEDADPAAGFVKRALVGGATGLALPAIAAVQAALGQSDEEKNAAVASMGGPGFPRPEVTTHGATFAEKRDELKGNRARGLGFPDAAALEAQEEIDREEHPVAARVAGFAGGMLDPTNVLLGMPGRAVAGLSPVVRTAIAHALPGAGAGALAAQGAGADAAGTAKAAGLGALIGTALGKGAEHLLGSGGRNEAIEAVTSAEAQKLRLTPDQIAARKAALEGDVFSNPEATAAVTGNHEAQAMLGPRIEEWTQRLLAKHNITPGSKVATALTALEDAIESGDIKAASELRSKWDAAWQASPNASAQSAALKKDIDALLNLRAVKMATEVPRTGKVAGEHGGGRGGGESAFEANPTAQGAARLAPQAIGGNPYAAKALGVGLVKKALAPATEPINKALATLYLARQTGNMTAIQQAFQYALEAGVPFSAASQIAGAVGQGAPE